MEAITVRAYIDLKSPFALLALAGADALVRDYRVVLDWQPFMLDLESFFTGSPARLEAQMRKVKYSYMDARRLAAKQDLTILGPKKRFDSRLACLGLLYAKRAGAERAYAGRVLERFFKRELDIEDRDAVEAVLRETGVDPTGFAEWAASEGGAELKRIEAEAAAAGVFGVPTFVLEGELFWGGDRLALLRERLDALGLRIRAPA